MKQIAQNYRSGELVVLDVPAPSCAPGGVLVATSHSLISAGTELMKVNESKLSLMGKARARPDQVRKVVDTALQQGVATAYQKAVARLDSYSPLGYSLSGTVIEVGRGVEDLSLGQLVACGGNEHALHAEVNWVPVNLCVPVPEGVEAAEAAFATVASIALQGLRQAEVQLGDTACVIGLGLVGQILVRLLVASGVRVVGVDVRADRCRLAEAGGALHCSPPGDEGVRALEEVLLRSSAGVGADRVFLAAGGESRGPVELAARLARDRGMVVDIGKCQLDLPWNAYYEKELDVRFSRSYGPGRYDPSYELDGVDYPAGYVRWTERRNMACVLDLLARRELELASLIAEVFPVTEAPDVYERLRRNDLAGVGYLFTYPERKPATSRRPRPVSLLPGPRPPRVLADRPLRIGFIGAGNYASAMLLPHLAKREDVTLARVATRRSLSAVNAQRKFGFHEAGTDADEVLEDESVDAVFVVTRHSTHAGLVCRALEAGKAVFVEKPLCLSAEELEMILKTAADTGNDRVMVGFNRRFAPLLTEMRQHLAGATRLPVTARYLVSAGRLPADSWYLDEQQEGSRFLGEGGHFIDTLGWWIGSDPVEVAATPIGDAGDLHATIRYADGSLGAITYITSGHPRFPKETFDVSSGGRSGRLDNFTRSSVWSGRHRRSRRSVGGVDKGQRAQLDATIAWLRSGADPPISLESAAQTTRVTLAIADSLTTARPQLL